MRSREKPWFRHWPSGVPRHLEYPEVPLFTLLSSTAAKSSERVAFTCRSRALTFGELDRLTDGLAASLVEMGLLRGERVLILLPNVPEFVISYYATLKAGGIVTAANPLFKEFELKYHLEDSEAVFAITQSDLYTTLKRAAGSKLKGVIVVGDVDREAVPFNELVKRSLKPPSFTVKPKEDVAVLQYTGGTTGMPKGAMMTHYNLIANAVQNAAWFKWTEREVVMGVLPLCHTWGSCVCMNSPIYVGARTILIPRFNPEEALKTVEREKVTVWYGSATMFNILINHPGIGRHDLSSLRYVKVGAMPVPTELKRRWEALTGVPMIPGYGLTEASPETHTNPPERVKEGSIGIPIIDTEAKVVDVETGTRELKPGEVGELVIRGPQVMKGYWRRNEETANALRGGWLYTGDLARMDEEGYFYIVDRKKDIIKYKGYSVYPAELENVLYTHPAIKECAVVGKTDLEAGEIPKAFVVLKEGFQVSKDEIIRYCEERVAPYKRIREVEFVSEIPKTLVGKVLRRKLRKGEEGRRV